MGEDPMYKELRQQIAEAEAASLATEDLVAKMRKLAGTGMQLRSGRYGKINDRPKGGAVLVKRWAIYTHDSEWWYPTLEAAQASLWLNARECGVVPSEDGMFANWTEPGCFPSYGRIDV